VVTRSKGSIGMSHPALPGGAGQRLIYYAYRFQRRLSQNELRCSKHRSLKMPVPSKQSTADPSLCI
jgi:hypothetical protein